MKTDNKIKTVIIDDDEEYISSLKKQLAIYPTIEIVGTATKYTKAKALIISTRPDLLFLDIEMPTKNGFELLKEIRENGCTHTNVVFFTAYDKYTIQALRESAFDYLLKPVKQEELKMLLERFIKKKAQAANQPICPLTPQKDFSNTIALSTIIGFKFIERNDIVLVNSIKGNRFDKPCWEALTKTSETIKLKKNTSSKEIIQLMGDKQFVQINQSCILNLSYLCAIEFKTRCCILVPPFNELYLTVSRSNMSDLRDRFDML
jgi:two-component system LytT family response regulator